MANLEYTESRPAAPASGGEGGGGGFGFRGVMQELRRVVWPTREELIRMTIVVISTVIVVAAFIAIIDFILQQATTFVYGS